MVDPDFTPSAAARADERKRSRAAYVRVLNYWHQADPDHCGGECFRAASIDAALAQPAEGADRG